MYRNDRQTHRRQLQSFSQKKCKKFSKSTVQSSWHKTAYRAKFTASQLHSFTASQLHSFTASQLHSFTASQLRVRHARIINSQPNTHQTLRQQAYRTESFLWCAFFILHRLIKPQRAQNPQRIIKECLTKPLLKHLASLACSAVKLKNIRRQRNA